MHTPGEPGLGSWLSQALKGGSKIIAKTVPGMKNSKLVKHYTTIDKPSPTENALYASEGELKAAAADLAKAQKQAKQKPAAAVAPRAAAAVPLYKNPLVLVGAAGVALLVFGLVMRRRA